MATNYGDESRFECSLCLDRFADPRILPCIHTFCRNCLEKYLTEKYGAANPGTAFECPLCRAKHMLPSGGIGGIQKNFYLEAPVRSQFPLCDTHPEEDLRFYCRNCDAAICRDCKVVSHESHTADLIKSLFAEVKSNFEDCLDDTEKNINENEIKLREAIEPEILSLETLMSDTKSHARILKRDIDNLVQDIEGLIRPHLDGKKQELLNIEEQSDEKRKYLNDYYQRLLKAMESEEKHHILMLYKELVGKMKENESIEEFHFASKPGNLFDADRLDSECFRSFEVVAESIEECKKRISDCCSSAGMSEEGLDRASGTESEPEAGSSAAGMPEEDLESVLWTDPEDGNEDLEELWEEWERNDADSNSENTERMEEEAASGVLDDLFRKTRAQPCIYWLPLTKVQIEEKENASQNRMEEEQLQP